MMTGRTPRIITSDGGAGTERSGGRGEKRQKPGKWEAARGEIFKSHCIIEEREGEGEREREREKQRVSE